MFIVDKELTVLCIDDDQDRYPNNDWGKAVNCEEAIEALNKNQYNLIIVDIDLKNNDSVMSIKHLIEAPIIIITSTNELESANLYSYLATKNLSRDRKIMIIPWSQITISGK